MKKTRTKVKPLEHNCKDCLFIEIRKGKESCAILNDNFKKQPTKEINTCSNWQN